VPRRPLDFIDYSLRSEVTEDEVSHALSRIGRVHLGAAQDFTRTLFDTFDGRLLTAGTYLESLRKGTEESLVWRRSGDGSVLATSDCESIGFAWDLADGPFRTDLEAIIEMRMLAPLVGVRSAVRPLEVRNNDGKLVLRGSLQRHAAALPSGAWGPWFAHLLRFEAVRGYKKEFNGAGRAVRKLGAVAASFSLPVAALEAAGKDLPDYSNKVRVTLEPSQQAAQAVRLILLHLLEAMETNEAGARAGLDSEFLHDFRVAVRRTRSMLSQMKGVLSGDQVSGFKGEFGWLGTVTGPARDMDVYLLTFPSYLGLVPAPMRPDLEPLHTLLRRHQRREHRRVDRALGSRRYRELVASWRAFLEDPVPSGEDLPRNAGKPIVKVASKRIRSAFDLAVLEGEAIDESSPPSDLHELRKTCKKLRYLLEFFQSLYDAESTSALIKTLKALQDNLGEYQDLSVQIHSLEGFEEELRTGHLAPDTTFRAIDVLVDTFRRRQEKVRAEFADRFLGFSAMDTRMLLEHALRSGQRDRKGRGG
jgi:CHAD domain-containing protein